MKMMRNMLGCVGMCVLALRLAGCGFFVDPTTTTATTTTPGAATGDYVYVVNPAANTLSGYVVGTNTLTAISGLNPLAVQMGFSPRAVAVTRANTFLYIGGNGAINCYSIGTGGVLTAVPSAQLLALANFVSMDTSPDGQWLLAVNATYPYTVNVYGINQTTGALTTNTSVPLNVPLSTLIATPQLKVQPVTSASIVVVSTNTAGTETYSFNTVNGTLAYVGTVSEANFSDNGVAFDATGSYVYVARADSTGTGTSGVVSFQVLTGGGLTGSNALTASGSAPSSLAFDKSGTYLYTANAGASTVSGYTVSSGTPTALSTSPFSSIGALRALTPDNSGSYMLGVNLSGTNDVSLYKLDTTTAGKLDAGVSVSTGTAGVTTLAATH